MSDSVAVGPDSMPGCGQPLGETGAEESPVIDIGTQPEPRQF
jgi:hypothetical protein